MEETEKPTLPYEFVSRQEWGARKGFSYKTLYTPTKMVRFVFRTETELCYTKEECAKVVRDLQDLHMDEMRLPDINYNFLIGGDGNVYEGRGFKKKISKLPHHYAKFLDQCLTVGYLGNHEGKVPALMEDASYLFMRHHIEMGDLISNLLQPPNKVKLSRTL